MLIWQFHECMGEKYIIFFFSLSGKSTPHYLASFWLRLVLSPFSSLLHKSRISIALTSMKMIQESYIVVSIFTFNILNYDWSLSSIPNVSTYLNFPVRPSHEGFIMYIVSYVIFFVTYFALMCCKSVRRKSPVNMIVMGIFTLALSIWVAR